MQYKDIRSHHPGHKRNYQRRISRNSSPQEPRNDKSETLVIS